MEKYKDGNLVDLSTIVNDVLKVIFEENKDEYQRMHGLKRLKDPKGQIEKKNPFSSIIWRRQWLDILKTNPTSRCFPDDKGVLQYHSSEEEKILREKIEKKANEIHSVFMKPKGIYKKVEV